MPDHDAEIAALERFGSENPELVALERRIGRFNVFDALRIAHFEIRHSNFLAWLLDPVETHGQHDLFLRAVLTDLFGRVWSEPRPFTPEQFARLDLRGVDMRREWQHIDLLIITEEPPFVLAIENKVSSGEHGDQLARYEEVVDSVFNRVADSRRCFAYLTVDGGEPSSNRWVSYSYRDLHRVLTEVRNMHASSFTADVRIFLDHYLHLIGSRFMGDPKIDDLCQTIFREHRQAIDLIIKRIKAIHLNVIAEIQTWLKQDCACKDIGTAFTADRPRIWFVPEAWSGILPRIGRDGKMQDEHWAYCEFYISDNQLNFNAWIGRVSDQDADQRIRTKLISSLCDEGPFSILPESPWGSRWTPIFNQHVINLVDERSLDSEHLIRRCREVLAGFARPQTTAAKIMRTVVESTGS